MASKQSKYGTGSELLKARREELGLSLRQLSAMAGITPSYIKDIEKGRYIPTITVTLQLLESLGIPMKEYLEAVGYKDTKKRVGGRRGLEPRTR